jgi:hypothetical protein
VGSDARSLTRRTQQVLQKVQGFAARLGNNRVEYFSLFSGDLILLYLVNLLILLAVN